MLDPYLLFSCSKLSLEVFSLQIMLADLTVYMENVFFCYIMIIPLEIFVRYVQ